MIQARWKRSGSLLIGFILGACTARSQSSIGPLEEPFSELKARLMRKGAWRNASLGQGALHYLGFETSPREALGAGETVQIVHYWKANEQLPPDHRIFVHGLIAGARGIIPHGDHRPTIATHKWPRNRVMVDRHRLKLPPWLPGTRVALRVGLYGDRGRLPVDTPEHHDGSHRLLAGSFAVEGTPMPLPQYAAPKMADPPTIDGRLDDPAWIGVPWTSAFVLSHGRAPSRLKTRARLGWSPTHLYVAMEGEDPDILATFRQRDDPIYREEAMELFIDPEGKGQNYTELQLSPSGVQFDASFEGGPRRNMRRDFDARFESAVHVEGSIGNANDAMQDRDRAWSSEWAIDVASLPGVSTPLKPGMQWRINLFRIAKDRIQGRIRPDESAWSPPLMGDFHNPTRFGVLRFVM